MSRRSDGERVQPNTFLHNAEAAAWRTEMSVRDCHAEGHAAVAVALLVPRPYFQVGRVMWAERAANEIDRLDAVLERYPDAVNQVGGAIFIELLRPYQSPASTLESVLLWWVSRLNPDHGALIREGDVIVRVMVKPITGELFRIGEPIWHQAEVVPLPR